MRRVVTFGRAAAATARVRSLTFSTTNDVIPLTLQEGKIFISAYKGFFYCIVWIHRSLHCFWYTNMRIRLPPSSSMLAAALLMLSFERTSAEVIPYHKHSIVPLHPEYLTIPKYSAVDAPHWSPGHGHSFIDLSRVTLHNECNLPSSSDCRNSTFQMLMFEETTEMYWMDYWPNRQFCCTSNMITEGE